MTDFIVSEQFINSVETKKMSINSECSERQLCSKQDAAAFFSIEEEEGLEKELGDQPIDIIAVFDGHGPDLTIDIIRQLDLPSHFTKSEPSVSMQEAIDEQISLKKKENNTYSKGTSYAELCKKKITIDSVKRSGATLSFAKIYRNTNTKKMKIQAEWLGDSPIFVFVNGALVFQADMHNASNESEVKRLQENNVIIKVEKATNGFRVLSDDRIEHSPGKYVMLKTFDTIAVTRSLGHDRILGVHTQKHIIECSTEDEVKVVLFSDGVGDILNLDIDMEKLKTYSAVQLVEFAEQRWKQIWKFQDTHIKFPANGYDDCCCAVWTQKSE